MRLLCTIVFIYICIHFGFSQLVPDFSLELSPASVFGSFRDSITEPFERGYSLQPKLGIFARILDNVSAGVVADYNFTGGDLFDQYTSLSLIPTLRYNIGAHAADYRTLHHSPVLLNRLTLSAEVGYQWQAFESDPEFNRGKIFREGLSR